MKDVEGEAGLKQWLTLSKCLNNVLFQSGLHAIYTALTNLYILKVPDNYENHINAAVLT